MTAYLQLTEPEVAMYREEAAQKIAKGDTFEKVARDFRWPVSDVKALAASKLFRDRLHALNPDAAEALADPNEGVDTDEILRFVDKRMPDYIKRLDYFAMNANSEQVAFNALIKLISMRKVDEAAENTEVIKLDERHERRMIQALQEAFFGGSTEPTD